jgi:hypothetical protein
MMFSSSNAFHLALVLAAAFNAVTSASDDEPVNLLNAGNYVILTKTGISTVPTSDIDGDIAVSPIAAAAVTGFSLTADSNGLSSTSSQLRGTHKAFAANYAAATSSALTTAVSNMEAAYTDAAGRLYVDAAKLNLGSGILGAGVGYGDEPNPLTPGVYTFGSDVTIAETIYFQGTTQASGPTDVFIIQMTGNLMQAANTQVILANGVLAKNIFWQVAGEVKVGVGAHLEGILLVQTSVLFQTGSSLNGRVLAQTRCDLQVATIIAPAN